MALFCYHCESVALFCCCAALSQWWGNSAPHSNAAFSSQAHGSRQKGFFLSVMTDQIHRSSTNGPRDAVPLTKGGKEKGKEKKKFKFQKYNHSLVVRGVPVPDSYGILTDFNPYKFKAAFLFIPFSFNPKLYTTDLQRPVVNTFFHAPLYCTKLYYYIHNELQCSSSPHPSRARPPSSSAY
jgi:hypothetical protein